MDRSRIAIVIPALNESETISKIVFSAIKYGVPIVVDDGSTDSTAILAKNAGAIVVSHVINGGYDAALNSGFKKAAEIGFDVVITLDADGQHDPSLIQKFIDCIDEGAEIVAGVRNRRPRLAEHIFALYTNIIFDIHDPLCGMKAYTMKLYKKLGHFDSYKSIGTELIIYSKKNGCILKEINFQVADRCGASRFGQVFSANYKIFRAMFLSMRTTQPINITH